MSLRFGYGTTVVCILEKNIIRLLAQVAGCRETLEAPVNFQKYLTKTKILPGSLEEELEKHKQYVAIRYNYFYKEEIASGKMKARVTFCAYFRVCHLYVVMF